jgi:TolB-like protein/Tfp pilus assembly protein PilF
MTAEDNDSVPPPTQVSPLDLQLSACAIEGYQNGPTEAGQRPRMESERAQADIPSNTVRLAVGQLLGGRYRIERELGEGGMGVVYLAADEQVPGERFAIKLLKDEMHPEALTLLREEVRKTRKLSHPNIVDVHSVNVDGQRLYVLMEYLEGKSLDALLAEEFGRGMPFSHAWPIIEDVAAALGNAHDHNVIHSDIKPANVFVTTAGRTKLLDFGIARISRGPLLQARSGSRALTPAYASCEMLEGKEADRRDDIYSFACVIYEMLSGERPLGECTALDARDARARPVPLAMLSRQQNAALTRALAFERGERTDSVEALLTGLSPEKKSRPRSAMILSAAIIAAAAAFGLTYLALDRLWVSRHSVAVQAPYPDAQPTASNSTAVPVTAGGFNPPPHSIAVLPLANESGDANQQYFSDGLSEGLITALSQFPGLKVIGRHSSFRFRDSKEDSKAIGAKLGVAHLLEGTVRRAGGVVRVSAELIDTSDGSTQWSERYDRPYTDLFALQDDITQAVAGALKAHLLAGEDASKQSDRPPSGSLDAFNAVLEGNFYFRRDSEADTRRAIERFTLATRLDPHYALAWSFLSRAWMAFACCFVDSTVAPEMFAKARAAADTAVALAPGLANAHIARGRLLQVADLNWRGAEAEYRHAVELAPGDGYAKVDLGLMLATFGQLDGAMELVQKALAIDPLNATYFRSLALILVGSNRLDEAEGAVRKALELQPSAANYNYTLTVIETRRGKAHEALAAAQALPPGYLQHAALALARQIGDDRNAADAALKNLIDRDARNIPYVVAQVYAIRNESNNTFEWLDRAWRDRDWAIDGLLRDPFIMRYANDPRFATFCRKVGLPTPAEIVTQT